MYINDLVRADKAVGEIEWRTERKLMYAVVVDARNNLATLRRWCNP